MGLRMGFEENDVLSDCGISSDNSHGEKEGRLIGKKVKVGR